MRIKLRPVVVLFLMSVVGVGTLSCAHSVQRSGLRNYLECEIVADPASEIDSITVGAGGDVELLPTGHRVHFPPGSLGQSGQRRVRLVEFGGPEVGFLMEIHPAIDGFDPPAEIFISLSACDLGDDPTPEFWRIYQGNLSGTGTIEYAQKEGDFLRFQVTSNSFFIVAD